MPAARYHLPVCAICTKEARMATLEPLGRNGTMVRVCLACATETPREAHGVERSYSARFEMADWKERPARIPTDKPKPPPGKPDNSPSAGAGALAEAMTPTRRRSNARLHRIQTRNGRGIARTYEDILRIAKKQPWFERSEYLGKDARFYVFQEVE